MDAKWRNMSLESVRSRAAHLARERECDQFHTPRNLLSALVAEVGDLSECFQWKGEVKENLEGFSEAEKVHVAEEMADVLVYLVRMADKAGIDLPSAVGGRMDLNAVKYPGDVANCRSGSHTEGTDSPVEAANPRESGPCADAGDGHVAEQVETVSVLYQNQELDEDTDCFFDYGVIWRYGQVPRQRVEQFIKERARALLGHRPQVFIDVVWAPVLDFSGNESQARRPKRRENRIRDEFSFRFGICDAQVAIVNRVNGKLDGELQEMQESSPNFRMFVMDILDEGTPEILLENIRAIDIPPVWHAVVHGTIALNEIYLARESRLEELGDYVSHVRRLFKGRPGLFIVTSGVLSESELMALFRAPFHLRARLRHGPKSVPDYLRGKDLPHRLVTLCFHSSAQ